MFHSGFGVRRSSENRAGFQNLYFHLVLAVIATPAGALAASELADEPPGGGPTTFMSGPTSIPAQLEETEELHDLAESDNTGKLSFLEQLEADFGLNLAVDYTSMFQGANDVVSDDKHGASGVFRLYGTWTLFGKGTRNLGSVVAKIEHRHGYVDTTPSDLATNVGYLGVNAISFTDVGAFVAPLYWQQILADGAIGFVVGRIDPLDFVDVIGIGSQWTSFQNAATLANLSLPLPDLGCGGGVGKSFNDQWVTAVSVHDLNGSQTNMDCFPNGLELYKQAYLGWSPSRSLRFDHAFLLTVWQADSRDGGQESGEGVSISTNWRFKDKWMPFLRFGVSSGGAAAMKSQLSTGMTYSFGQYHSQIGAAISFQTPADDSLANQTTFETYLRWQISPSLALSPNLQILGNPALNPDRSTIVLGGFRVRYTP